MRLVLIVLYGISTILWAGALGACIVVGASVGFLMKMTTDYSPFFLALWVYVIPCVCVIIGVILAQVLSRRLWHGD